MKFPIHLITGSSIWINMTQPAVLRPWQLVQIIKSINVVIIIRLFLFLLLLLFLFLFFISTWFIGHISFFLNVITARPLNNRSPNTCTLGTVLKSRGAGATFLANKLTLPAYITNLLSTASTNSAS
jgi:hypothetical protein